MSCSLPPALILWIFFKSDCKPNDTSSCPCTECRLQGHLWHVKDPLHLQKRKNISVTESKDEPESPNADFALNSGSGVKSEKGSPVCI